MTIDPEALPVRMRDDNRTATWNPALTRAAHVLVHVRARNGSVEVRRSVNSGRVRVRDGESIDRVLAGEA
jgi:predicted transcriptional regulator